MKKAGFTFIEILVTITIIAMLTAVAVVSFAGAQKKARDAKRKTDLEAIRSALEMYKADKGCYPCGTSGGCPSACNTSFGWAGGGQGWATNRSDGSVCYANDLENILETAGYINVMPRDPKGGCEGLVGGIYFGYMYYFSTPGQNYCLYAHLENPPVDSGCSGCPVVGYDKNYCVRNP